MRTGLKNAFKNNFLIINLSAKGMRLKKNLIIKGLSAKPHFLIVRKAPKYWFVGESMVGIIIEQDICGSISPPI